MPRAILDENVSLQVAERLTALGYDVHAIAKQSARGITDEAVFALTTAGPSLLVTRDTHFTNPIRFHRRRRPGSSISSMEISADGKRLS